MKDRSKLATISRLEDRSYEDRTSGAVRSVQTAEVSLPEHELRRLWTPVNLERLARTYWRFLTRVTLGIVRVVYSEGERSVVLLARPLKLLTFTAPEYEMEAERGLVRWRIERGLLVAKSGRGGHGHLQIDVRRLADTGEDGVTDIGADRPDRPADTSADRPADTSTASPADTGEEQAHRAHPGEAHASRTRAPAPARVRVRVEVEVANFHPAIASGLGRRVYNATQGRIHVFITHGFLRSLARLHLAESRVGRLTPNAGVGTASPNDQRPPSNDRRSSSPREQEPPSTDAEERPRAGIDQR
jgi:hypothetical protein